MTTDNPDTNSESRRVAQSGQSRTTTDTPGRLNITKEENMSAQPNQADNLGVLTFKRKDASGHFYYSYKVSDYHAAVILQYIAQFDPKPASWRDGKGRFVSVNDLVKKNPDDK